MKYLKAYESQDQEVLKKCKLLFGEVLGETLDISRLSLVEQHRYEKGERISVGKFSLTGSFNKVIDNDTVSNFISLFDFLRKVDNIRFRFSNNRFQIHMDSVDSLMIFIDELEMLKKSKNYNL